MTDPTGTAPADAVVLVIGTGKGAYSFRSNDGGTSWSEARPHLSGWEVSSMRAPPYDGHKRLLAGTAHLAYGAVIRVSDDLGATWRQIPDSPRYRSDCGLKLNRVWQIVAGHPGEPGTLFAGVDMAGLFVSRDSGETWTENIALSQHATRPGWTETQAGLFLHSILVDPNNHRRMWVGISNGGVFRTEDAGESWLACNRGLPLHSIGEEWPELAGGVHKIALDPTNADTLYMQHCSGVFKSTDAGDRWFAIEKGLPTSFGFTLGITRQGDAYVVPLDHDTRCFPDGRLGVYRLRRGSLEWEAVGRGLPDTPHYVGVLRDCLTIDDHDPAGIYFGTSQGDLFWLADESAGWERLPGRYGRINNVAVFTSPAGA